MLSTSIDPDMLPPPTPTPAGTGILSAFSILGGLVVGYDTIPADQPQNCELKSR